MTPYVTRRSNEPAPRLVVEPDETAIVALGKLEPGCRITGFTRGQFSLIDLIRAVLAQTGPAHLTLSTWTAGVRDMDNIAFLTARGDLLSLTLLVDRSFPSRQPDYCRKILRAFGPESIRCTRTHAKFALIENETWRVVIRSSMNLNRNPRFEQFDLDDDADLCAFFKAHVDEMLVLMPPGFVDATRVVDEAFGKALGGKPAETHSRAADRGVAGFDVDLAVDF